MVAVNIDTVWRMTRLLSEVNSSMSLSTAIFLKRGYFFKLRAVLKEVISGSHFCFRAKNYIERRRVSRAT